MKLMEGQDLVVTVVEDMAEQLYFRIFDGEVIEQETIEWQTDDLFWHLFLSSRILKQFIEQDDIEEYKQVRIQAVQDIIRPIVIKGQQQHFKVKTSRNN
jgi:hypothetical protein